MLLATPAAPSAALADWLDWLELDHLRFPIASLLAELEARKLEPFLLLTARPTVDLPLRSQVDHHAEEGDHELDLLLGVLHGVSPPLGLEFRRLIVDSDMAPPGQVR